VWRSRGAPPPPGVGWKVPSTARWQQWARRRRRGHGGDAGGHRWRNQPLTHLQRAYAGTPARRPHARALEAPGAPHVSAAGRRPPGSHASAQAVPAATCAGGERGSDGDQRTGRGQAQQGSAACTCTRLGQRSDSTPGARVVNESDASPPSPAGRERSRAPRSVATVCGSPVDPCLPQRVSSLHPWRRWRGQGCSGVFGGYRAGRLE